MRINKNISLGVLLALSAASTSVFAADGTVNFTGSITSVACKVVAASQTQTVDLGKISSTAFTGSGSTAGAKQFTISLDTCPAAANSAIVHFDGTQVVGNNNVFALTTEAGVATGVGIQIADNNNKVLGVGVDSTPYTLTTAVKNDLNFTARYIATAATVVAGKANAVTTFSVIYP